MAITIVSWVCRVAIAGVFAVAAVPKLAMQPEPQALFSVLGGRPVMLMTGVMEVIAAVLVLIPKTKVYGAVLAMGVMGGAIVSHLAVLEDDSMLPAAVGLFVAAAVLLVLHRSELLLFGAPVGETE